MPAMNILTHQPLIECVPNFSDGRRPAVVDQIAAAITNTAGVALLDLHQDADHNRAVATFVGPPLAVLDAAFAAVATAQRLISLDEHRGTHPRIGAADVVPFVPLGNATLAQCVALARQLGARVGGELGMPVYLYEAAATRPDRHNLADVRRGGYEGLRASLGTDPSRTPDFGPAQLTPAGATAIGAREVLIAYNVYLDTDDVAIARHIARAVRERDGGLPHVKALGMVVRGRAQVSINLTDYRVTSLGTVWDTVAAHAATAHVVPVDHEIVGLLPAAAVPPLARYPQFAHIAYTQTLDARLHAVGVSVDSFSPTR